MTVASYDVVIIGAGIVGAACARECARAGLSVLVVEAGVVGGGATGAGMGHLVVMDDSAPQFALTRYSQTLWDELAEELPRGAEYEPCGTIWVAGDDEEMAAVRRKEKFYAERGVAVEVLDPHALAAAEPNLREGLAGGLRVPGDSVLYPPSAAKFLISDARSRGAELLRGEVVEIRPVGVLLRDGSSISAGLIVNAAGNWSPIFNPDIDVQKRKGHLVITDRYPGFLHHQLIELGYLKSAHSITEDSVAFNIQPRSTGQMLIGSSRQFGVEDAEVETPTLRRMLKRALEYMPDLGRLSATRAWTGFRAATPDKLPLIGPCADREWLYLATGHEGLGITTSLGTARLLVDQMLKRTPAISPEPYLPSRITREVAHA